MSEKKKANEAIEFYYWMRKNDIEENAEIYFQWSVEDMFMEFLKQKHHDKTNADEDFYGPNKAYGV
tara:strand:- start:787 stop:984 length:198 start_codon:yes stop_codon:yes gene_type:complete